MVFEVVRKNTLVAHALQMKNEKILASKNRNVFICLLCGSRIQMMSAAQVLRLMILLYMYSYINVSKHRTLTLEKKNIRHLARPYLGSHFRRECKLVLQGMSAPDGLDSSKLTKPFRV